LNLTTGGVAGWRACQDMQTRAAEDGRCSVKSFATRFVGAANATGGFETGHVSVGHPAFVLFFSSRLLKPDISTRSPPHQGQPGGCPAQDERTLPSSRTPNHPVVSSFKHAKQLPLSYSQAAAFSTASDPGPGNGRVQRSTAVPAPERPPSTDPGNGNPCQPTPDTRHHHSSPSKGASAGPASTSETITKSPWRHVYLHSLKARNPRSNKMQGGGSQAGWAPNPQLLRPSAGWSAKSSHERPANRWISGAQSGSGDAAVDAEQDQPLLSRCVGGMTEAPRESCRGRIDSPAPRTHHRPVVARPGARKDVSRPGLPNGDGSAHSMASTWTRSDGENTTTNHGVPASVGLPQSVPGEAVSGAVKHPEARTSRVSEHGGGWRAWHNLKTRDNGTASVRRESDLQHCDDSDAHQARAGGQPHWTTSGRRPMPRATRRSD
jgi:hypothetical protein